MTDIQRLQTLSKAELFSSPMHKSIYRSLKESYKNNDWKSFDRYATKLPTEEQLFNTLCAKLEKKSVGTTLKKIVEGKANNKYTKMKAYTSLLTHSVIECEAGNTEYKLLFEGLINKIIGLV